MPAADYDKQQVLGEGTFGVVTRAVARASGAVVAIKKLRRPKAAKDRSTIAYAITQSKLLSHR